MNQMQTFIQMGYTQAQYRKAKQYSQKNYGEITDIFDALQQVQRLENNKKLEKVLPANTCLNTMNQFRLNEYNNIYKRQDNKENNSNSNQLRDPNLPVGLLTVSNCCYLNSLLQCYFLMGSFTREILQAEQLSEFPSEVKDAQKKIIINEYSLLETFRSTFAKMRLSNLKYIDGTCILKKLINSVGQKIEYGDEKDIYEIHMAIIQRLSECFLWTKKYYSKQSITESKYKKRQNVKHLFYGQKIQYIEGQRGSSVVDFMVIILNPEQKILQLSLDTQFNYDVQISGTITKKHSYIKILPTYLFFTINRTQYKKQQHQLQKNTEKLQFDFEMYMDKYLQKNKQSTNKINKQINQLLDNKNQCKLQINYCQSLIEKLQKCQPEIKQLGLGLQKKILSITDQIQKIKSSNQNQLKINQEKLSKMESKQQKYVLFFLFVHRGNGVSGHYWGYGRNGKKWYKFDEKSSSIEQSDILPDIQRFQGTPYGLVYAKDNQLQNFDYRYYTEDDLQVSPPQRNQPKPDYLKSIPMKLKKQIITDNMNLLIRKKKQQYQMLVKIIIKQYIERCNFIKQETDSYLLRQKQKNIPFYSNFGCYLRSIGEFQLMKLYIFDITLQQKAKISCSQLTYNEILSKILQQQLKNKIKQEFRLKTFTLDNKSLQDMNYKQQIEQYLLGKKCIEFLGFITENFKSLPQLPKIQLYLDNIIEVIKSKIDGVYIRNLTEQIIVILLIERGLKNLPIKSKWLTALDKQYPVLARYHKNAIDRLTIDSRDRDSIDLCSINQVSLQSTWIPSNIPKKFQNNVMDVIRDITLRLSTGFNSYKNSKKIKISMQPVTDDGQRPMTAGRKSNGH